MNNNFCDCPEHIKAKCRCTGCDKKAFECFKRYSMIMAAAGTGKTFSLSMRYLQLLAFGADPSEILAVTFTRKATGEIFDEIIANLLKMIVNPQYCYLSKKECLIAILKKLLCTSDKRISTIDSFFGSLLQAYAPELGISGEITMIDAKDDRPIKKLLRQWLRYTNSEEKAELRELLKFANSGEQINFESSMSGIIKDMHPFYQQTLHDSKGYCVWGMTLDSELKLEKLDHDKLMLLSDKLSDIADNESNQTAKKRIQALSEYIINEKRGNIPDIVKKLLENFIKYNAQGWMFEEKTSQVRYTSNVVFEQDNAAAIRQAVGVILQQQLEKCRKKTQAVFSLIQKFDQLYNREIRSKGMLTFADLPLILRNSDDAGTFHLSSSENMNMEERLDATINHYLFDEFQDTSNDQWYIFSNLVDEILSTRDDRFRSLFCVGDIKQSIYQWRGGDPNLFENVIKETRNKTADLGYDPQSELFKSYRSSQTILDAVNAVFTPDNNNKHTTLNRALKRMKFTAHISERKDLPGFTAVINTSAMDKKQITENQAAIILNVLKEISPFNRNKKLTVGVLMQQNKDCELLATKLKDLSEDLPISIEGKIQLKSSMAFMVLKKLITLSSHPADTASCGLLKMLSGDIETDYSRITPKDIAELMKYNVPDECGSDELSALLREDIFQNGLDGFIQHFLDAFGKHFSNFDYERIMAARTLAENFEGTPEEFLHAVQSWYNLEDQSIDNTVQFMTIHKSKGLGLDIVFLPDMSTKSHNCYNSLETAHPSEIRNGKRWINYFPYADICKLIPELTRHQELVNEEHQFEECCKFYVAMTRAKQAMYIFADNSNADNEDDSKLKFQDIMCRKLQNSESKQSADNFEKLLNESVDFSSNPLIYASGDENWFKTEEDNSQKTVIKSEDTEFTFYPAQKKKLLASQQDKVVFSVSPENRFSVSKAADTGTKLHELFEKIQYITADFSIENFLKDKNVSSETAEIFTKSLADGSELKNCLAKPIATHILWREQRFLVKRPTGETVPGAFDRVIIYLDANGKMSHAEILDFKSDNVKNCVELSERHCGQMRLYRECLSQMTEIPEEKIKISLAALRLGKIVEIN